MAERWKDTMPEPPHADGPFWLRVVVVCAVLWFFLSLAMEMPVNG